MIFLSYFESFFILLEKIYRVDLYDFCYNGKQPIVAIKCAEFNTSNKCSWLSPIVDGYMNCH